MLTKKGEQWYADWIVMTDVCMDLPGSFRESKDEVLLRLDNLLRQQGRSVCIYYNMHLKSFPAALLRSI